jgi:hypothetical protein
MKDRERRENVAKTRERITALGMNEGRMRNEDAEGENRQAYMKLYNS